MSRHKSEQKKIWANGDTPAVREERIRRRAYELWIKHGKQSGREIVDWLEAEREVDDWEETRKIG
jgi:hypothetical protein